jgi:DNA-binding MarR family transcriptional regulator
MIAMEDPPGVPRTEKSEKLPRFDSLQQEVYLALWRTYDRLRKVEEEFFDRYDLTAQQYNVLRLLRAEHPGTMPTLALANRLISRAPDITRILDKLENRNLVVRERQQENRRVVRVGITTAGLELLKEIAEPLRACHARQLGHLSEDELNQLRALLKKVREPHEDAASIWR